MSIDTPELTRLETLPTEILHAVVDHLPVWGIKNLSRASKRLRQACLSALFCHVKFGFSKAGIEGLNDLLKSNVCGYIASFTYGVIELLKTATWIKPKIGKGNPRPPHLNGSQLSFERPSTLAMAVEASNQRHERCHTDESADQFSSSRDQGFL